MLQMLNPFLGWSVKNMWDLKAATDFLGADQDNNGVLQREEYRKISQVKGDGYFSSLARDFEFAVVDELKVADGKVSLGELSTFYSKMDSNNNGKHSQEEFKTVLSNASYWTKFRHPIASFTHTMSQYTALASDYVSGLNWPWK